jgi:hypothetical protein
MVLLSVLVICFGGCWIRADLGVDIESSMYDIALVYCLKSPGGKSSIFLGWGGVLLQLGRIDEARNCHFCGGLQARQDV